MSKSTKGTTDSSSGGTTVGGSGGPKGPKRIFFILNSLFLFLILISLVYIISIIKNQQTTRAINYYQPLPAQSSANGLANADTLILYKSKNNSGTATDTTGNPKKPV